MEVASAGADAAERAEPLPVAMGFVPAFDATTFVVGRMDYGVALGRAVCRATLDHAPAITSLRHFQVQKLSAR